MPTLKAKPKYTSKAKSKYTQKAGAESKPELKSTIIVPVSFFIDKSKKSERGKNSSLAENAVIVQLILFLSV